MTCARRGREATSRPERDFSQVKQQYYLPLTRRSGPDTTTMGPFCQFWTVNVVCDTIGPMNQLPIELRIQALNMLVEGSWMRSISRILGVSFNTVKKLLRESGQACIDFHDIAVRNVPAGRVECDEIWSFCYAKDKQAKWLKGEPDYAGSVWTWIGVDADSKLMISWLVGGRDAEYAYEFMHDLAPRLRGRVQLTTDGHHAYLDAVRDAFRDEVDYAQLVKVYGPRPWAPKQRRYITARKVALIGSPGLDTATTAHSERKNLTIRMALFQRAQQEASASCLQRGVVLSLVQLHARS